MRSSDSCHECWNLKPHKAACYDLHLFSFGLVYFICFTFLGGIFKYCIEFALILNKVYSPLGWMCIVFPAFCHKRKLRINAYSSQPGT